VLGELKYGTAILVKFEVKVSSLRFVGQPRRLRYMI
jgi:hypothetical protein